MRRRLASLLIAVLAALTGLSVSMPAAHAGPGESEFTSRANGERTSRGIKAYVVKSDLVSVARQQAQRMASAGKIYHNPNLASDVKGWQSVGENVGMGGDVASIHQAFMNSSGHRANILDRDFTEVGMGTATDASGKLYVAQVFRQPDGSAPVAAPSRPKPPVTAKAPAPSRVPLTKARPAVRTAAPLDPAVLLRQRFAAARAAAAKTRAGVLNQAAGYHEVMKTLGG